MENEQSEPLDRETLLNMAHEEDERQAVEESVEVEEQPIEKAPEPAKPTEAELTSDEQKKEDLRLKRERDDKGRYKPKAGEPATPEAITVAKEDPKPATTEPKESDFVKAQKEADRRDRSWKALDAEKEEVRRKADEIRQAEERINQRQAQPMATKEGFTAQDYASQAFEWRKQASQEPDPETKALLLDNAWKAAGAAQEIQQFEIQHHQQSQAKQIETRFMTDMQHAISLNPELGDPNRELSKRVGTILEQNPDLYYMKQGFSKASQIAKLELDAAAAPELRKENERLTAELEKANRAVQPSKGSPGSPSSPVAFEKMSQQDQRAHLIRAAEEADENGE